MEKAHDNTLVRGIRPACVPAEATTAASQRVRRALAVAALALAAAGCQTLDPRLALSPFLSSVPPLVKENLPRELLPGVPVGLLPGPVARGPYLQMGTESSIVVRWRTSSPTDSKVSYGTEPGSLTSSNESASVTVDHELRLTDLAPDTLYFYSIGSTSKVFAGADGSHSFRTAPEPGTAHPTRIWVLGDSGTATIGADSVRDAYLDFTGSVPTDLWLMLGDNAYSDGTDEQYQRAVFNVYPRMLRSSVLWPTLGNHDGRSADSSSESGPYYDIFTLPRQGEAGGLASGTEAYYSFDHGNIHFVCLDSQESDLSPDGAMFTWLRADLASTAQHWLIAFWHHPPYSKGSHDSDSEGSLIAMRERALPILEEGGVDLVLCGHSHSYERSFLIDGHYGKSGTFSQAMVKDGGDGRVGGAGAYEKPSDGLAPHEGTVYVVAGSSGRRSGGSLDHPVMFVSLSELGSLVMDVDGDQLVARFLNANGTTDDHFTIRKPLGTPGVVSLP